MAAAGGRGASQDVSWYYASLARMFEILAPGSRADELSRLASELTLRAAPPARLNASGAPREGMNAARHDDLLVARATAAG